MEEKFGVFLVGGLLAGLIGPLLIIAARLVRGSPLESDPAGRRMFVQSLGGFLSSLGTVTILSSAWYVFSSILIAWDNFEVLPYLGLVVLLAFASVALGVVLIRAGRALGAPDLSEYREQLNGRAMRRVEGVGWLLLVLSGFATVGFSMLCLPLLLTVARGARNSRVTRQGMLLWSLAVAAERRLPLIPEFDDFALVNGGAWRSRAREVSERLRAGESLAGALDRVPGLLPRFVTLSIQVGEETGSLPRALREAALTYTARQQRENGATSWSMFWILMSYLLVVGGATVSFILYFIVPKFKVIFQDFGAELPPVTLAAIRLSESVPLLVIPFGGLTALFAAYLIGLVRGWEELDIPGVDRLFPHINGPPILRNLATVIEAGRPMAAGVAALADGYPRRSVRRRLVRVLETVEAGGDCWQALRKVRLLRPRDVALLNAAERVGNLPWALRTLADSIQRRRWNRLLVWTELAQPALIVLVGLFVFFIVTAFFYPTVSLLKTMESQIG